MAIYRKFWLFHFLRTWTSFPFLCNCLSFLPPSICLLSTSHLFIIHQAFVYYPPCRTPTSMEALLSLLCNCLIWCSHLLFHFISFIPCYCRHLLLLFICLILHLALSSFLFFDLCQQPPHLALSISFLFVFHHVCCHLAFAAHNLITFIGSLVYFVEADSSRKRSGGNFSAPIDYFCSIL